MLSKFLKYSSVILASSIAIITYSEINTVSAARYVNKAPLQAQLRYASSYQKQNYTAISFQKLTNDINIAKRILNAKNVQQWQITQQVNGLHNDALNLSKLANSNDKAALRRQLGYATSYNSNNYTVASYARLASTINWTTGTLNNPQTSQWLNNYAIQQLHTAALSLVANPVINKAGLVAQIGYSKAYVASSGQLQSKLLNDISVAQDMITNSNVTQLQINQQIITLHNDDVAILNVQNFNALKNLVNTAYPLTDSGITKLKATNFNLFNEYAEAYNNAVSVVNSNSINDVNGALLQLKKALNDVKPIIDSNNSVLLQQLETLFGTAQPLNSDLITRLKLEDANAYTTYVNAYNYAQNTINNNGDPETAINGLKSAMQSATTADQENNTQMNNLINLLNASPSFKNPTISQLQTDYSTVYNEYFMAYNQALSFTKSTSYLPTKFIISTIDTLNTAKKDVNGSYLDAYNKLVDIGQQVYHGDTEISREFYGIRFYVPVLNERVLNITSELQQISPNQELASYPEMLIAVKKNVEEIKQAISDAQDFKTKFASALSPDSPFVLSLKNNNSAVYNNYITAYKNANLIYQAFNDGGFNMITDKFNFYTVYQPFVDALSALNTALNQAPQN